MDNVNRILLLDGVRQRLHNPIILTSPKELDDLVSKWCILESPPDLTLDIRSLPQIHLNSLLKFIEDYQGRITMIANDSPVSRPILSRFTYIEKNPEVDEKVTDIRYQRVMKGSLFMTNNMKTKILDFLEINVKDVEAVDTMFSDEYNWSQEEFYDF